MNLKDRYWLDTSYDDVYDEHARRRVYQFHLCTQEENAVLGRVWNTMAEQPGIWMIGLASGLDNRHGVSFVSYSSLDAAKAALEHYVDGMIDLEPYRIQE